MPGEKAKKATMGAWAMCSAFTACDNTVIGHELFC